MSIISGLNISSVARLKATWEAVDAKLRRTLTELELLISPHHNYRTYRALLDTTYKEREKEREKDGSTAQMEPFIPILGIFLKDLFFINDGNKTTLPNDLINFDKFRTLYKSVSRFSVYQQCQYPSPPPSQQMIDVNEFCRGLRWVKEAALYRYSCLCEAKVGESEGLRDKWMKEEKSKK